jgi:hypothetical protein
MSRRTFALAVAAVALLASVAFALVPASALAQPANGLSCSEPPLPKPAMQWWSPAPSGLEASPQTRSQPQKRPQPRFEIHCQLYPPPPTVYTPPAFDGFTVSAVGVPQPSVQWAFPSPSRPPARGPARGPSIR